MAVYENAATEIIRLGIWNHRLQNALAKDFDVPVYQLECLLILSLDRPESAGSLAELLGIRKTSLSKLLKSLEIRGLVNRNLAATDRRQERVTLSKGGIALVERIHGRATEIASELLQRLPEERRSQFLRCVRTITAHEVPMDKKSESKHVQMSHETIIS